MPTELQEALTAAGVSALIQKVIDPMLLEYVRRYSPLTASIPAIHWESDQYYFNTRTALVPGGFVTDGGARPVGNSTYVQSNFQMAHLLALGAVTGYAQEVTRAQIGDLRRREIEGAVKGLYWDIETALVYGRKDATANGPYPQFDGIAQFFKTGSGNSQNMIDAAGAGLSLGWIDSLIDMVESNAAESIFDASWMIVLSPTANSRIAQLLTNQQRFNSVTVAPGLIVPTYRDIPLVKSSFLASRGLQMNAVTTTPATTGGTLATGTFKYQVSAVMSRYGEILPCTEVSATTTANTSTVTLAFTPPAGPDGAVPLYYQVWRTALGGATGTETLLGYADGVVGTAADGVTTVYTTSIVDTGSALIPQNGATQPGIIPSAYFGGNTSLTPKSGDDIYLMSRDPDNIVRPWVRDVSPVEVYPTTAQPDALPFALVSDTTLGVRAPKYGGRLRNVSATLTH